ncbi:MAG: hypothetical protein Q7S49_02490 [bacterium]|nr:hypothetical protein [bacterium]
MNYWKQKATPWVSLAVLAGGLVSAVILFWLVKIEAEFHVTITNF